MPQSRIHTRLFSKQSRMWPRLSFSMTFNDPNLNSMCKRVLEIDFHHGNLKNLHANERVGHGKLPGRNGVGFRRLELLEFVFEVLSSIG